ncbi:YheV family putative zinc ribbon protein [Salicola sp. Rm-C-2C1-2]|uniref:YheV family putative zinc ribbon protein n=1 Tax=Salicola sp. Rm-C-2C1-2 TaxID=3141321 RepID=UPI0032E4DE22
MKKRFIAGAVCPRCSAMDRIVMFTTEEGTFRECVECGFEDRQPEAGDMTPASEASEGLKTRVTATEPDPPKRDDTPQPVRILPSGSGSEH